jgi:hypothetical protein
LIEAGVVGNDGKRACGIGDLGAVGGELRGCGRWLVGHRGSRGRERGLGCSTGFRRSG